MGVQAYPCSFNELPDLLFGQKSPSAAPVYHPRVECAETGAFWQPAQVGIKKEIDYLKTRKLVKENRYTFEQGSYNITFNPSCSINKNAKLVILSFNHKLMQIIYKCFE